MPTFDLGLEDWVEDASQRKHFGQGFNCKIKIVKLKQDFSTDFHKDITPAVSRSSE